MRADRLVDSVMGLELMVDAVVRLAAADDVDEAVRVEEPYERPAFLKEMETGERKLVD